MSAFASIKQGLEEAAAHAGGAPSGVLEHRPHAVDLAEQRRRFGGFRRERLEMADWIAGFAPDTVVMESTGIYWKSPYAYLERLGIRALVVNAQHVKKVPGRKTDVADAEWLAMLARAGLLRGSFIPPERLRHLRQLAGKRRSAKTPKGNRYVRALPCEIAWSTARTASQFKSRYQGLVIRRGAKRAIVAIAHQLLKIVYVLLARRVPYRDDTVDHEALAVQRKAPRWIRQLKKFGHLPQTA